MAQTIVVHLLCDQLHPVLFFPQQPQAAGVTDRSLRIKKLLHYEAMTGVS